MHTLTRKLLLVIGLGLVAVFAGQLATRTLFELPALRRLEASMDRTAVERARLALRQLRQNLEMLALDYGAWDDMYRFSALAPSDPGLVEFVARNLTFDTHELNHFSGMLLLNESSVLAFASSYDLATGRPAAPLSVDDALLMLRARGEWSGSGEPPDAALIGSGAVEASQGPVLFAASEVLPSSRSGESRGTLIVWRHFDETVMNAIRELSQAELEFTEAALISNGADHAALYEVTRDPQAGLRRDAAGWLRWAATDVAGHPLFLVRQKAAPRAYDDSWFSPSFAVGLGCSALVLIGIGLFLSRTVIEPIRRAGSLMEGISRTGDYTERLAVTGRDELNQMFNQFNRLLAFIHLQNEQLNDQNRRLAQLSEQDALTGIANRRFLDDALRRSLRQAARLRQDLSVLMIDVDCFKAFNDNYGHQSGDQILQQVANVLRDNLHRATDYLARYGGEEFCAVLMDTDESAATRVAERLREAVQRLRLQHAFSTCADIVTISVGVASVRAEPSVIYPDLLKIADRALYQAKRDGRNRVAVASARERAQAGDASRERRPG